MGRECGGYCLETKNTKSMSLWKHRMTLMLWNFSSLKPACLSLTRGNVYLLFLPPLLSIRLPLTPRGYNFLYIPHYKTI